MKNLFVFIICGPLVLYTFYAEAKINLKSKIKIDGSSTLLPMTQAVAQNYHKKKSSVKVTLGVSGTGGGFKKFCAGETDINNASRLMKDAEVKSCLANKVAYKKIPIAYDGISVILNKKNTWATALTTADLKKIWEPESKVRRWSDLNNSWPQMPIKLYAPGSDSGTFDYFTKKINGKAGSSRSNYTASESDNIIISGVAMDKYALGYVGFAYYHTHQSKLKVASVDGIKPSRATMKTTDAKKQYSLSRLVYIYINKKSAFKPVVHSFVSFFINHAKAVSATLGYRPLDISQYHGEYERFSEFAVPKKKG